MTTCPDCGKGIAGNGVHICKSGRFWLGDSPIVLEMNDSLHSDGRVPETKLNFSNCGCDGVHMTPAESLVILCTTPPPAIEVGTTVPGKLVIKTQYGQSEFDLMDVYAWANGDMSSIDWATGEASLIIEALARVIVNIQSTHDRTLLLEHPG